MKGLQESDQNRVWLKLNQPAVPLDLEWDSEVADDLSSPSYELWMSNGGSSRSHPARALPFSLEVKLDPVGGTVSRIHLVGILARFADGKVEPPGTIGGSVQLLHDQNLLFRQDLIQGRHYRDASVPTAVDFNNGDGTSLATVGEINLDGAPFRLDHLAIDVPSVPDPTTLVFRDLGSPASFGIIGLALVVNRAAGCPFHSKSGLIPLREVGAIIRVGDRRKFSKALSQLEAGVHAAKDLDEARGLALTFLAMVTAGMLESGGSRELHKVQLEAARELEQIQDIGLIGDAIVAKCEQVAEPLFATPGTPSGHLVDRALAIVDRNFARNLSDDVIAEQLGLSTSHFRFLFKQATGNPFHKYLIAVRLEKARQLLLEQDIPVSQVAEAVGFAGLSHFSRAFSQRFSTSPSSVRRQKR